MKFNSNATIYGKSILVKIIPDGQALRIPLYYQDFPFDYPVMYKAGDVYNDDISWLIPVFAPIGHYTI